MKQVWNGWPSENGSEKTTNDYHRRQSMTTMFYNS